MRRNRSQVSRRICFVTGSRAEFGLMRTVLQAIRKHPQLELQIVVTGMHLDRARGKTIERIRDEWRMDATVEWAKRDRAVATGKAVANLANVFSRLNPDVVLIVGDRVEAFAAATAAHLRDIAVAHIHGGDRALGQMDDSLRHAISKLAHIHFPATRMSAERLVKMGEDRWRIHRVGSPGIDGIEAEAKTFPGVSRGTFALVLLHPTSDDESLEYRRAMMILDAVRKTDIPRAIVIYPNNDPGAAGIIRCWKTLAGNRRFMVLPDVDRTRFLGLLRDAAFLVGNSSSGIIEAASFRTPVIDVGPRQLGRERADDVVNVPYSVARIAAAVGRIWNGGKPRHSRGVNPYQGKRTGEKIGEILAKIAIDDRLLRKIISY